MNKWNILYNILKKRKEYEIQNLIDIKLILDLMNELEKLEQNNLLNELIKEEK